jgi:hypothetical protein
MFQMGLGSRIRRLFSSTRADDEAAEREEYGTPDRGEAGLEREGLGSFAANEAAQAGEDELEELKAPRDPAP